MELTAKQQEGLTKCVASYRKGKPYFCIAGYAQAGTGKSTLVKFIISALGVDNRDVCYIAYTGKAALVLQEKGCPNAMTAHKLLYKSFPRGDGTFYHKPARPLEHPYKVIVTDEVSMLPKEMWDLLLSHHRFVIALGDPFQLPPINANSDNHVLDHPDIFLEEIMRQAQDSEIIRLSMDIRAGKPLEKFDGKEVQVIDKEDVVSGMFTWADQVIVAKNQTRHFYNDLMREYKFGVHGPEPMDGDKIICLRNNWNVFNENDDVLVNGLTGYISNIQYLHSPIKDLDKIMLADFVPDMYSPEFPDRAYFREINMDQKLFLTHQPTINAQNFRKVPAIMHPNEFDYGYAITAHKSQGSEFDKVLVIEENFPRAGEEHQRWLYTAVTRASKKLVLVRQ